MLGLRSLPSLHVIFSAYGSVFILGSPQVGCLLALVTCLHPNVGITGLLGLGITTILLQLLSMPLHSATAQATLRNGLLVSLLIGDLFVLQPIVLPFLTISVLFSLCLTTAMESLFIQQRLPVISLPFCISALIIFMMRANLYEVSHFENAAVLFSELPFISFLPTSLLALFRAIGSILCLRDAGIGFIILTYVAITSPLTAFFLVTGFFIGTATESFFHVVTSNPLLYSEGYNYSLVFTAIAAFVMVPSVTSFLIATCAVIMTSAIVMACNYLFTPFYLPILSIPFNIILLLTILSLKSLRPSLVNHASFATPEHSIETARLLWSRHRLGEVGIFLPTEGAWKIQQGFDGHFTHRGLWRHALDFVAVDDNERTFVNTGLELTDYFSFGKPVFAPLEGYIVGCIGSDPDNKIGQVMNSRNWGNHVIIRSYDGICVTLAHLKSHSVIVKVGDKVLVGQKLGECGNSGYSQEPHLHVQVHHRAEIGDTTIPFHLLNYSINNRIHFHRTPLINETLKSLKLNQAINNALNFKVGETIVFKQIGLQTLYVTFTHQMNELTGQFYLTDGVSRLYIAKIGLQFYFYGLEGRTHSPIWDLFAAAPKIPITYGEAFEYYDELPLCLTQGIGARFCSYVRQFLKRSVKKSGGTYVLNKQGLEIRGACHFHGQMVNTFFRIDPALGIQEFSAGTKKYGRVYL